MVRPRVLSCWILAALLALPALAYAAEFSGDLDRDGHKDIVRLDPAHQSVVSVWLSGTNSHRTLRLKHPVYKLGFFDVDGDGRAELVVSDASARVHVWRTNSHGRLRPYAPRRQTPQPSSGPGANVDDDDGDPADAPVQGTLRLPAPFEQTREAGVAPIGPHARHVGSDASPAVLDGPTAAKDSRGPPPHVLLSR